MSQRNTATEERFQSETSRVHYILEFLGILSFFVLALLITAGIYRGMASFGCLWLLPVLAVLAYLAADSISGFVHFLGDNFGSVDTPVIGTGFVGQWLLRRAIPGTDPRFRVEREGSLNE